MQEDENIIEVPDAWDEWDDLPVSIDGDEDSLPDSPGSAPEELLIKLCNVFYDQLHHVWYGGRDQSVALGAMRRGLKRAYTYFSSGLAGEVEAFLVASFTGAASHIGGSFKNYADERQQTLWTMINSEKI